MHLSNLGWGVEGTPRARLLLQGPPGCGKCHLTQVHTAHTVLGWLQRIRTLKNVDTKEKYL